MIEFKLSLMLECGVAFQFTKSCSTPRPSDHSAASTPSLPYPNLSLPHPSLSLDFRICVALNPLISVGATPFGHRNWISFTGGTWSASWGSGVVLVSRAVILK